VRAVTPDALIAVTIELLGGVALRTLRDTRRIRDQALDGRADNTRRRRCLSTCVGL